MSDQTVVERPQNLLRVNQPYRNKYKQELEVDDNSLTATPEEAPATPAATPTPGPELSPEDKVYKQRYDSLKTHYDKTVVETKKELAQLREQLGKASLQNTAFPKTEDELKQWATKYPDLYGMIVTLVKTQMRDQEDQLNDRVSQVEAQSAQAKRAQAEANLMRLHPDLPELLESEDFHGWVKLQPMDIQKALYENSDDYMLAARMIDLYKADKARRDNKPNKTANKANLNEAARSITKAPPVADVEGSQGKQWKLSEIEKLSRHDFERFENEIDKARLEGRIIYDR